MPKLRLTILAAALAVALVGCTDEVDPPAPEIPTVPTPDPSPEPTAPTPEPSPEPDPDPEEGGSGGADEDPEPAAAGGGICENLTEAEVFEVVGAAVSGKALSGGGCVYEQRSRMAPAVSFEDRKWNGSLKAAKDEANSAIEGIPQNVPGVGQHAFVLTGTSFGQSEVQGAGAVHVGNKVILVRVNQQRGVAEPQVRQMVVKALRLAARRA